MMKKLELTLDYPDWPWTIPNSIRRRHFLSSSSSASVPYTDHVYNGETARSTHVVDDYSPNDLVYVDKNNKYNSDNRRPSSRNNSKRSVSLEKVSVNGEKDDIFPLKPASNTNSKQQHHFRPTGIRQSYLRGEQYTSTTTSNTTKPNTNQGNGAVQKDDLVAMGTLWNPNSVAKSSMFSLNNKSLTSNSISSSGSLSVRRGTTTSRYNMGTASSRKNSDVEPKYTDPAIGATNSFQQRLIDLSALEAETVRWERTKKLKKKPKQDRDS